MPHQGILFVLVGPSGAGKNTLMNRVREQFDNLQQLATMTTRAIREGEQNGLQHWFVSHAEFQHLVAANALVEWQRVHLDDLYGTPRQTVDEAVAADRDLIADIEFLGAEKLDEAYPANSVLVFVTPSSLDILAERIRQRGDSTPEESEHRLGRARYELTFVPRCDYLILNDAIEPATDALRQIIESERLRRRGDAARPVSIPATHTFESRVSALIQDETRLLVRSHPSTDLLPAFTVDDHTRPLHDVLQTKVQHLLGQPVQFESIQDDRFDFVAPHHIAITGTPPNVDLDYFYKCSLPRPQAIHLPGWEWRPLAALSLPAGVGELVRP